MLIDGLKIDDNKSLKQSVIEEIYKALNVTLFEEDIQQVTRFGVPNGKDPPKTIRVVLYDPDIKNNLMAMRGRLRPTDIYFKEYLTPKQLDVYIQAKRAQRNNTLFNGWSENRLIHATETEEGEVGWLSDLEALIAANLVFDKHKDEVKAAAEHEENILGFNKMPMEIPVPEIPDLNIQYKSKTTS